MYTTGLDMKKQQAKETIKSLIARIPALQNTDDDSPEFEKWKRDTRVAIRNIFAGSTSHIQDFENQLLGLLVDRYTSGLQRHNHYLKFLDTSRAILESMIEEIDQYWPSSTPPTKETARALSILSDPTKVFVVHGRNTKLLQAMFAFLRSIGLNPIEWNQAIAGTKKGSPSIAEILDTAFNEAQAVIVLLTGDDEAKLRRQFLKNNDPDYERQLTPQSRPNVLFESGMAIGRQPDRTILVQIGEQRPFTDIAGKHITHMDNTSEKRQELATKLTNAGCRLNTSGTTWFSAGDFK
jgi:predicted nucleotide-binding protein